MLLNTLPPEQLTRLLERKRRDKVPTLPQISLDLLLCSILEKANEFVPSTSGSIFLDDPEQKQQMKDDIHDLIFVSCFGPGSEKLIGERIPCNRGIVGKVYQSGVSTLTNDAYSTPEFCGDFDKKSGSHSRTILCVPIRIEDSICGAIELMNKSNGEPYQASERELLEIFASYISSIIQNTLDAKRILQMVRTDDLTGLANDRFFHERLPSEVKRHLDDGHPLSLVFLDLDHFKSVNDTYGHIAGSAVLAEYGTVLRESVTGQSDVLVARTGGDEFVILLPRCGLEEATAIAECVRLNTEKQIFLKAPSTRIDKALRLSGIITVSVGVATLQAHHPENTKKEVDELAMLLLQQADKSMYIAKESGRNQTKGRCVLLSFS